MRAKRALERDWGEEGGLRGKKMSHRLGKQIRRGEMQEIHAMEREREALERERTAMAMERVALLREERAERQERGELEASLLRADGTAPMSAMFPGDSQTKRTHKPTLEEGALDVERDRARREVRAQSNALTTPQSVRVRQVRGMSALLQGGRGDSPVRSAAGNQACVSGCISLLLSALCLAHVTTMITVWH